MASVDFHCKCKGGSDSKAIMRHNDKEERMKSDVEHSNEHLDKAKTPFNLAYKNRSYEEVKLFYDKRILELDATTNTNKRKDRVTMFGLEIPRPPELRKEDHAKWFNETCKLVEDWVGSDNFIEGHFHVDEVHDYYDTEKKEWCTSVEHCHLQVIPEVDGKLNAKAFSSRKRMIELNKQIDKMTQTKFGVSFMTGEGKRHGKVEDLKIKSANAVRQMESELRAKSDSLDREHQKRMSELDAKSDSLDRELEERASKLEAEYSEKEAKLTVREDLVEQRENEVSDIKKSLKTQISALQDIYDRIEAIDETGAKRRWNYVQQHAPQIAEKVEKAVSNIEKRFNPNAVIDHRSETERDRDLTR